jgi:copper oxidase (laccase) domain-containing protein
MQIVADNPLIAVSGRWDEQGREFNFSVSQPPGVLAAHVSRLCRKLKLDAIAGLRQVHGCRLLEARAPAADAPAGNAWEEADGLYTTRPGLGLMIRSADCQSVVLTAPGLAANLHVGWRGSVQDFPGQGLRFLSRKFGLDPGQFHAFIAPSLGPCCGEFVNYRQEFPKELWPFRVGENHFNLWAVSAWQLIRRGLRRARLHISGICSKCSRDYYSHRRRDKGRFATVAALREEGGRYAL